MNRREWLSVGIQTSAALAISPRLLRAIEQGQLVRRAIPATGEMVPVIGLGSSATFSQVARSDEVSALKEVFQAMANRGATVFDTAPGYGASEEVASALVNELGIAPKMFWATKVNVAGRGGSNADPAAARAQIDRSLAMFKQPKINLIQVHNLGDVPTQLAILKEYKQKGRVQYIGVTTTSDNRYSDLEQIIRNEPLDFIGIDYAVDNRGVEERILPLAIERKIGVLAYAPFGRTSLFRRAAGKSVPDWGAEIGATTWAQVFLKFIVSHPAITAATPATSKAQNMIDNIGGGIGPMPDQAMRRRMAAFVDALPGA